MFKNELLIKYTEFVYGIYRNVHKMYTKRILSVYIFLIGRQETIDSFTWTFKSFLKMVNNHPPG